MAIIVEMEEGDGTSSNSNIPYCLSCISFYLGSWPCGLVAFIMAYKADDSMERGDVIRYRLYHSVGLILGVIGIFLGLAAFALFYKYVFPVWYLYLYLTVEPEYKFP